VPEIGNEGAGTDEAETMGAPREAQDSGQQRLEGFRKASGNILARL